MPFSAEDTLLQLLLFGKIKEEEMADKIKYLQDDLICHICMQVFVDPVRLPCLHNFCCLCITSTWSLCRGAVRCPVCILPYNVKPSLARNLKLANIVESCKALDILSSPKCDDGVPCHVDSRRDHMWQALLWQHEKIEEQMQAMAENLRKAEENKQQAEENFQTAREMIEAQYEKMHMLLMKDMHRTLHRLDKTHSQFCKDHLAQVSLVYERWAEAKQLLSSLQVAVKAENPDSMKDNTSMEIWLNKSEIYTSSNPPLLTPVYFKQRDFLRKISQKEESLQKLLEGSPGASTDIRGNLGTTSTLKRKLPMDFYENDIDPSCVRPWKKQRCVIQWSPGPSSASGPSSVPGPSPAPEPSSTPRPSSTPTAISASRPSSTTRPLSLPWSSSTDGPSSTPGPRSTPGTSSAPGHAPH